MRPGHDAHLYLVARGQAAKQLDANAETDESRHAAVGDGGLELDVDMRVWVFVVFVVVFVVVVVVVVVGSKGSNSNGYESFLYHM